METQTSAVEFEEASLSLGDYFKILRRRKKWVAISFGVTLMIAMLFAFLWPAKYQSEAIILIEEQRVPSNLVQTTITSYAQQRIETIKQRIMTIGNIVDIVEQYGLYTERELERKTRSEIANEFRKDVFIEPISADVVDPQSGRPREAVIAFSLIYEGRSPKKVMQVTSELTNLYLDENLRERNAQTTSTSEFLASEAKLLLEQLGVYDQKIAEFKEDNKYSLPELLGFNRTTIDRTEEQISAITVRIKDLEQSKLEVESRLVGMSPSAPVTLASGERVMGDADRLKALESEYRSKRAIYREDHPDLIRIKREMDELLVSGVGSDRRDNLVEQLRLEQDRLAALEDRYTDSHPQVINSKKLIAEFEDELKDIVEEASGVKPDNPAYLISYNQLQSINRDLNADRIKLAELREKLERHEAYLSRSPQVEKEYIALVRELQSTQTKYNEIRAKQMHAELAQNLESEQQGERFTLIQPAEVPSEPVSPNRPALMFLGVLLGGAIAVSLAIIIDIAEGGIYGVSAVMKVVGHPPLVSVAYMESKAEQQSHNKKRLYILIGLVVSVVLFISFFHAFVKPLDVTWYVLMRRFGL